MSLPPKASLCSPCSSLITPPPVPVPKPQERTQSGAERTAAKEPEAAARPARPRETDPRRGPLPAAAPACAHTQQWAQTARFSAPITAGSGAFNCSSTQETQTPSSSMASHTDGPTARGECETSEPFWSACLGCSRLGRLVNRSASGSSSFRIHYISGSMKDKPAPALDSCFLRGHSFCPSQCSFFADLSNVMLVPSISFNPSRIVYRDGGGSQAECP